MTTETFIDVVKEVVRNASVNSVETLLHHVPGRSPDKHLVALSTWHTALSDSDKHMVTQVIEQAVDDALFGFLCVLDGVRVVESNSGDFELRYRRKGESVLLSPNEEVGYLHDLYNAK
ncbi:hypothetical protein E4631_24380 [Hymenobacter sp. UV11]|uniref:hypothetical protein n=1 Tax=Hymenobacter sp. UV11 TaxID=1849735 RepID=UPI00105B6D05|nr:hypothetical protein [Hymenobacter sp. UV11]TDN38092.1 hypothetical protein A8B98_00505 [Hymenobacter sp. UV11]TDN39895.1 hypothetical protein A8B98_16460 [Hymenobacter sp. UV11]TFZ62475.1 hypothetical protein E4631_25020 [Hymenobacter sp. UV11]TFZ62858.1 hypothetical protein E4631_24380 [Hymenobacter sp. UV11]